MQPDRHPRGQLAGRMFTLCSAASLPLCVAACGLWVRSHGRGLPRTERARRAVVGAPERQRASHLHAGGGDQAARRPAARGVAGRLPRDPPAGGEGGWTAGMGVRGVQPDRRGPVPVRNARPRCRRPALDGRRRDGGAARRVGRGPGAAVAPAHAAGPAGCAPNAATTSAPRRGGARSVATPRRRSPALRRSARPAPNRACVSSGSATPAIAPPASRSGLRRR